MKSRLILITILFLFTTLTNQAQSKAEDNWMQWRGPLGTGVAIKGNPPVEFSETKNLKWKIDIPGKGHATPIIYEDKIIVQTSVATDKKVAIENKDGEDKSWMKPSSTEFIHDYIVLCIDRNNGQTIWQTTATSELPKESTHELGSWASNSPCTDGENIYAYFGSRGLFCLDFDGHILWQRDFGQMEKRASFGEGASPFVYKDRIFILWDHEGDSWLYCLDKKTGEDIWKVERDEGTSWTTPLVIEVDGKTQVITNATQAVRSYDYENGNLIWSSTGMTGNVIPVPMVENNILYAMSGFRGSALQAIDLTKASGDINNTDAIIWEYNQDTPYTPSAILMDGKLYFLRVNNGFLSCLNAKDGSVVYSNQKLEGISNIFSSPSGADGKIYIASKGICLVVKAGENFEILASNVLDDDFHASPIFVDNQLILRGFESMYCFEEE